MSRIDDALVGLRDLLGARRLVVWEVDADTGAAAARWSTGSAPPDEPPGTPLAWCAGDGRRLRLDPAPAWAGADVLALPVGDPRLSLVLTVEADPAPGGDGAAAADAAAAALGPVLALQDADRRARTTEARFRAAMAFLRDLAENPEAAAFPARLADLARAVTNADGAVVATWDGDEQAGRVVARVGKGGGPAPGTEFDAAGGELGLAARAGVTLRRGGRDAAGRPLAGKGIDRWIRPPADLAAVPLLEEAGDRGGLLGLWANDAPLDDDALDLLAALGPLLGVQLRHSQDLVRFRQEAGHDALTGLPNRAALEERLRDERLRFDRYRRPLALLVVDIDHFKRINDTHGHPAGDAVLVHLAGVLRSMVREVDLAARMGGEEFVVVLPETMARQAADVAERIRAAIEAAPADWEGRSIPVTASIGVAAVPDSVDDPDRLMGAADRALYDAKAAGRNTVVVATPAAAGG